MGLSLFEEVVVDNSELFSSSVTAAGCVETASVESGVDVVTGAAPLVTMVAGC